ncbi:ArgP/LysG family DNA-binding transcriptional regulator [Mycolicibacterium sediminis]|uniref:Putative HTH-type transcriptional regulator n=1 Tax=Mycolicibacterium sediminis TaxID=1286180 RepID=A0A7I7QMI8_9MYCO|nr:LysR family transcriptional regulator ArgP [Mycolicibacterium sediminis]BBY27599.1 putative HTH-type transcriptional regulator [Mycolicibacterium sediminis]
MALDAEQLAALAAVVAAGSFEGAAGTLHVTPSAVSQRIKALEQRVGQVLVRRERPCTATAAGIPLLRLAAQSALLEAEVLAEVGGDGGSAPRVALAVNADSMATWFVRVFGSLESVLFDVRIEDQDHSARLLREGATLGAVTTERTPVPGCRVYPLGVMRYVAAASAPFAERCFPDGFTARAAALAPNVAWNRDDALQHLFLRRAFRRPIDPPTHYVPSAEGFAAAVRSGVGWGMFPESLADADARLRPISDVHLDVPLFWQCWKLDSPLVARITDAVCTAAAAALRR